MKFKIGKKWYSQKTIERSVAHEPKAVLLNLKKQFTENDRFAKRHPNLIKKSVIKQNREALKIVKKRLKKVI